MNIKEQLEATEMSMIAAYVQYYTTHNMEFLNRAKIFQNKRNKLRDDYLKVDN